MHPDVAFRGLVAASGSGASRTCSTARCRAPRRCPRRSHEAMRYAALGGGKRVRPLLAYAAGELAGADPARRRCAGRRGRADPRVFAGARRPAVHGRRRRCAAASRRATSRSAKRRRCSPATRCRRSRSPCSAASAHARRRRRACALLARRGGRARHGGRAGDRPRAASAARSTLPELETMHRMKTGALIRAAVLLGARAGGRSTADEIAALDRLRAMRRASRSRSSTTCSTSKARPPRSARPPARTPRSNKPTYVIAAGPRRGARRHAEALRDEAHGGARAASAARRAGCASSPTGSCCATH